MKYLPEEDYRLILSDDGKMTGVGILKGKYAGVLYHYGQARVVEEAAIARLYFDYTILHSPNFEIHELQIDEEFHTMIGDILTDFLMNESNAEV